MVRSVPTLLVPLSAERVSDPQAGSSPQVRGTPQPRRRQHPPHTSHRRKGGDATDQLTQRAEHLATTGQFRWPPPGSSTVRHWADPTGR